MQLSTDDIRYALNYIDELVTSFNIKDPAMYPKLIGDEVSHDKAYLRVAEQADYTGPIVTPEGDAYPEVSTSMPFSRDFTALKYAAKVTTSREAVFTDQSGSWKGSIGSVLKNPINLIAQRYRSQRDQSASDAFANGFTAPSSGGTPTLDGVAQFSASHTLAGGVTANNLATSALSTPAIETMIAAMGNMKSYQGAPWMYSGSYDVKVPWGLAMLMKRISDSVLQQGTNDNDKNIAGSYINTIIDPYATDATDWFAKPNSNDRNPLTRVKRLPFESFAREGDGGSLIKTFHEEWVDVWFNWRGTYGSQV